MAGTHLLNLRVLSDADIGDYALLRFDGREAISEPFDYRLELIPSVEADLAAWIGKLVEWDVTTSDGTEQVFAGRIYATEQSYGGGVSRYLVRVRPAYFALAFGRATHFVQDKTSLDIFAAMTADVPGLTTSVTVTPVPPVRSYSVRYDETEIDYLARLLAQDGIMYFFTYDRGAGAYRHKMIVSMSASDYIDIGDGKALSFVASSDTGTIKSLSHARRAAPRTHDHYAFDVNMLDTPWTHNAAATGSDSWGSVYPHSYETTGAEAGASADLASRSALHNAAYAQDAETISGTSDCAALCAGGRFSVNDPSGLFAAAMVLTAVTHSAFDPWMIQGGGVADYRNSFTAMDAAKVFHPAVGVPPRQAPGPLLGVVAVDGAVAGEAKVDSLWRVPVAIAQARDYAGSKPLPKVVWLPVQQQWAHSTHGAQFFPRIGTRVIVDFLYGNPDLPFVSGTVYTPSQAYPFDPASKVTQTGWRSVSDKNGSISQEFHFEDKPGSEEIYLYTGRDFRRLIDNDDFGTIKHDQTLIVENDQTETVKHDAKLNVENDRTVTITGLQKTDVTKTRTLTVTDTSTHESMKEIIIKVGGSSITLKPDGIVIKAVKIEINADATLDVKAGAKADIAAPLTTVKADGMLTLKGGIVMIN
jgi:type VI secretion system secreted protein VgrG